MGFQQGRLDLAAFLTQGLGGWTATTETEPDKFHQLIEVGHASRIYNHVFGYLGADIVLTLWVDESLDPNAADELYTLLSPGSSLTELLKASYGDDKVLVGDAQNIGRRDEGPSGYLAGELAVTLFLP